MGGAKPAISLNTTLRVKNDFRKEDYLLCLERLTDQMPPHPIDLKAIGEEEERLMNAPPPPCAILESSEWAQENNRRSEMRALPFPSQISFRDYAGSWGGWFRKLHQYSLRGIMAK